ncbi:MAG: hypothetical protein R3362_01595 [Rhodothermales bacterium]|nr:hypothetical protein [Rhodothermales bacterium]
MDTTTPSAPVRPAALPPARSRRTATGWGVRVYRLGLAATWLAVAASFLLWGLDYYLLPLHERPYAPGHDLFKPTGRVGNRLAIAGTALLLGGVGSYMLRKRWRRLEHVGKLRHWLSFHIWCCTLGPFLVMLHTSFKVGGIVSIAFWSMAFVVASGVVGRYVYVRIPKTLNGRFRSMQEVEAEQEQLMADLQAADALDDAALGDALSPGRIVRPRGLLHALWLAVRFDWEGRRAERRLRHLLKPSRADADTQDRLLRLARDHRKLAQQRVLLQPFERLFRYWHTIHLPLAIVLFLVLALHIGVAIAFGYAWTP